MYFSVANVFPVCVNACIQETEEETGGWVTLPGGIKNNKIGLLSLMPHLKYGCTN